MLKNRAGIRSLLLSCPTLLSVASNPVDFHNTSLSNAEAWEIKADRSHALRVAELTCSTCWQDSGFCDFYQDVANAAQTVMGLSFDYYSSWEDGEPLQWILESYHNGNSASDTADDLLQGEAEAAHEQQFRDHHSY
jgi:hypothetical protein